MISHEAIEKYLNKNEYEVLRLSYGLDCDKYPAQYIADKIGSRSARANGNNKQSNLQFW